VDPKQRLNHRLYLEALDRLGGAGRLRKAFELSELSRQLFVNGLRKRYSDLPEAEFRQLMLERLSRCHNRNY
jgi:hypothetical protein